MQADDATHAEELLATAMSVPTMATTSSSSARSGALSSPSGTPPPRLCASTACTSGSAMLAHDEYTPAAIALLPSLHNRSSADVTNAPPPPATNVFTHVSDAMEPGPPVPYRRHSEAHRSRDAAARVASPVGVASRMYDRETRRANSAQPASTSFSRLTPPHWQDGRVQKGAAGPHNSTSITHRAEDGRRSGTHVTAHARNAGIHKRN